MITLPPDDFHSILAEVRLAPSVHNIQPSRWRMGEGVITLLGDTARSIPVADPTARDWRLSHGTAIEGLALALAQRGLAIADIETVARPADSAAAAPLIPIARLTLKSVSGVALPRPPIATRVSWRGGFQPIDAETERDLDRLASEQDDLRLIRSAPQIGAIARLADRAGLHFLRQGEHRRELLHWMRLKKSHPLYERDGLNARAMNLNAAEAFSAGLVLGPLFAALDRIGLAKPLVSEAGKTRTSAAVALFHRPAGEDPLQSGRAFYRAWLAMERHNLKACPVSVLADWPVARDELAALYAIPPDRRIVNAFRIGRPKGTPQLIHARLSVDELIV
jgi:nitroreductase